MGDRQKSWLEEMREKMDPEAVAASDKAYETYNRIRDALKEEHRGKWLLFIEEKLIAIRDTLAGVNQVRLELDPQPKHFTFIEIGEEDIRVKA